MAAPTFQDDKTPICVPFILERLEAYRASTSSSPSSAADPGRPFIIGLNGVQGAGKTTLVSALSSALEDRGVPTLVCSIDDFYLTHEDQQALARSHPDNALVQHRGEPGTHDMKLATSFFNNLLAGKLSPVPQYDKSAFGGQGDRAPASTWRPVAAPPRAVILEGWSVGFRPLSRAAVEDKWNSPSRTLRKHQLEHLLFVNDRLADYDALTELFDAFIHIDAEDLTYVYEWRQQQEEHLRRDKGDASAGMTPEQVTRFVDGYFPAYELYTDRLRAGIFPDRPGSQLRLTVGKDRKVKEVVRI